MLLFMVCYPARIGLIAESKRHDKAATTRRRLADRFLTRRLLRVPRSRRLNRIRGARIAAAVLSTTWLTWVQPPSARLEATAPAAGLPPLGELSQALASAMPVAHLGARQAAVVEFWIVVCAVAASWAAFHLYRGPARNLIAIAVAPGATAALRTWTEAAPTADALAELPIAAASTMAVALAIRPLVHRGFVTAPAVSRTIAWSGLVAVAMPRAGLGLLVMLALAGWLGRRRDRTVSASFRRWLKAFGIGLLPAVSLAGSFVVLGLGDLSWPELGSLHLSAPTFAAASSVLGRATVYPALALLGLLVAPLRWRGGLVLIALTLGAAVIQDANGSLAPTPSLLLLLTVASAGWAWLASTVLPRSMPRRSVGLATVALVLTSALALGPGVSTVRSPAAPASTTSVARIYDKGLVGPGDTVLAFGPWASELAAARKTDGWRPDIDCLDPSGSDEAATFEFVTEHNAAGRRVLSNSYNAGGRWRANWVLDSGPLFWLVGPRPHDALAFTDLGPLPSMAGASDPSADRLRTLVLERVRFRRAVGEPSAALDALPLSDPGRHAARTRLQLAKNARASSDGDSELAEGTTGWPRNADAIWYAEAADLLFAHGERERATELFIAASEAGHPEAMNALARWQVRSGADDGAVATLEAIAETGVAGGGQVGLAHWLVGRGRLAQAARLLEGAPDDYGDATGLLGARLRLLGARAHDPGDTPPLPAAPAITSR